MAQGDRNIRTARTLPLKWAARSGSDDPKEMGHSDLLNAQGQEGRSIRIERFTRVEGASALERASAKSGAIRYGSEVTKELDVRTEREVLTQGGL